MCVCGVCFAARRLYRSSQGVGGYNRIQPLIGNKRTHLVVWVVTNQGPGEATTADCPIPQLTKHRMQHRFSVGSASAALRLSPSASSSVSLLHGVLFRIARIPPCVQCAGAVAATRTQHVDEQKRKVPALPPFAPNVCAGLEWAQPDGTVRDLAPRRPRHLHWPRARPQPPAAGPQRRCSMQPGVRGAWLALVALGAPSSFVLL